jgi:putative methyltransferase (TIGR04325 family)
MSGLDAARAFLGRTLLRAPQPLVFDDRVGSWAHAQEQSSGYDQSAIVEQVTRTTLAVREGSAAFERDGVTFTESEYRWPIADALTRSVRSDGRLRVVDIGGSLGSLYWQHRSLLPVGTVWAVVEQPSFVAAGRDHCGDVLTFVESPADLDPAESWDIAVFSSVLQYLPDPWAMLRSILDLDVTRLVIDRTPFHHGPQDIATVQRVPAHIYPASYPAWILSDRRLREELADWTITAEFPGIEPPMRTRSGVPFTWSGCVAERRAR